MCVVGGAVMNKQCNPNQKQHAMTIAKYRPQGAFINPFGELVSELFNRDIGHVLGHDDVRRSAPAVNILEREKEFELRLLAPGFSKEDLKLSMENEVLTISAEKKNEELKETERWTRREFAHSAFRRSFSLPDAVNIDSVSAAYTNGVLHVYIPKAEVSKPKTREINIG